ncbi:MAG TPA: ATP-dependent RecD-like DNA helicase [Chthonomonadales bacterium]|nr:ATP-dependent RecD-like DNA helicase [Chthonomonadales bacterium]
MRPPPPLLPVDPSPSRLEGVIERITFHAEETGYTVARIAAPGERDPITAVGAMGSPNVGESVRLHGRWSKHREFGRQFQVERYETIRPATAAAIEKYLGSGLVKGVGPAMARRIVSVFGEATLDVIEEAPRRLLEVPGIGAVRMERIRAAWAEQRAVRAVMLFLQGHGVSPTYAVRIYRRYGDDAIRVVELDPYRLAADIWGIGFRTADKIARELGFAIDSPERLRAGILYTLQQATDDGHMYVPEPELIRRAAEILEVDVSTLPPIVAASAAAGDVTLEAIPDGEGEPEQAIYMPALYRTEVGLAARLRRLAGLAGPDETAEGRVDAWLDYQSAALNIELSPEQRRAVYLALSNRFLVLTGGPGTGKTTVTNLICRALEARRKRVVLASPTGRAAKRLSEVTGRPAQTIHRLLKYDPTRHDFQHDEANPLDCDALIADETSMLDAMLAHSLLKAAPDGAQIVFVGDPDQLPSVGPGNVLGDIVQSGVVPVCRLTTVFRQAARSLIITNAHRVNRGEMPMLPAPRERGDADCAMVEVEDSKAAAQMAVTVATRSLPRLGFAPSDIQVLAPMHRGEAGVGHLNERLQELWNPARPGAPELLRGGRRYRAGDRVIQLANNYDRNVFNGDVGTIRSIDPVEQTLTVAFPEAEVPYDYGECDELQLAYALSVHKSQGSEYPAVVLVLTASHYVMLQRRLLYTALTRARRLCVLVGEKRAVGRAVRNDRATRRYTRLSARITGAIRPRLAG